MSRSFKDLPTGCGYFMLEFMRNLSRVLWCGPDLYAHTSEIKFTGPPHSSISRGGQFLKHTVIYNIFEGFIEFCESVLFNQLSL